jgi:hypothetical protein
VIADIRSSPIGQRWPLRVPLTTISTNPLPQPSRSRQSRTGVPGAVLSDGNGRPSPAELIRRQPAQMEAALVLAGAPSSDNIFYRLCPPFLLLPLVVLATIATIIASQSIITGARRGEVNIPAAFFSVPSSRKSGSQQTHRWRKGDSKPRSPTGSAAVAEPYTPKTARRTLRRS